MSQGVAKKWLARVYGIVTMRPTWASLSPSPERTLVFSLRHLSLVTALVAPFSVACMAAPEAADLEGTSAALAGCPDPASGTGAICDLGDGKVRFSVTLPSGQQYVEVFSRQNGLQNVATNIVSSARRHLDGTTTYSLERTGYNLGDLIEYRFYSYLPRSPGRFTPGPQEMKWLSYSIPCEEPSEPVVIDEAVSKDASLIYSSYAYGVVPDRNFGANTSADVASYHHDSWALFGYPLTGLSSGQTVTKAELVIPAFTTASGPTGSFTLFGVTDSASWSELTVTRNTAPAATSFAEFTVTAGVENRLDVTALVDAAVSAGATEVSFLLKPIQNHIIIDAKEKAGGSPTYLHVEAE
jgi:hypothetical protein